ncbi:TetR family transcriptional regulator [Planosporangium flavigriseum]|uniref:Transcriptional regulator n=1 Tax=Planosporangium flavigriseum TaxID=373681 RepID=A0A8J3PPV6_9ACTN|nr:TetR family transcriptional regulator [Planosporangium flavigriseum]NJC67318.1 TetR family transcriptional regulator [Planosporangium flavigriseum]GIG75401.1 transcriptional regulator [Planosporangium flavigriseum]
MTHTLGPRAAQKLQTRQSLLEAALRLTEEHSLGSVSLREVSRAAGIVPAGFYRHFPDVESLGVALVEQSLGGLRTALRAVRSDRTDSEEIARRSVQVLAREVRARRAHFRFIARERYGGMSRVREAIRDQLRLLGDELATDLLSDGATAATVLRRWDDADVRVLTSMIVDHMISTAAAIVDVPAGRPAVERRIINAASKQLRLIIVGARHWLDPT